MLGLDSIEKIVGIASLVGAMVGGLVSFLVNLWSKARENADKIAVRYGRSQYREIPGHSMYIVSRRNHQMEIGDFGFVLPDGRLVSVPMLWEHEHEHDEFDMTSGSTLLAKRNDRFEINVVLRDDGIVGAYAITTTQKRPSVSFKTWDPPGAWTKLRVRAKLSWTKPEYW